VPDVEKQVVNGVALAVRSWPCLEATRPPVVLLPGTGATATDWDTVAAELCHDRTVHALDLRGHGESDWPGTYSIDLMAQDVAALLPRLGPELDLVGHSLGGLVACKVTAGHPTGIRRLVLEEVGVLHPRPAATPALPEGPLLFDWAVVEQVRPQIDDPDPRWREVVAQIRVPTLVIGGGSSSFLPQEHVRELAQLAGQATLVTIAAGHLIHAAKPREFLAELHAFLDS
jgi:pimeloyl-ACP methyl ester carboxylesterase